MVYWGKHYKTFFKVFTRFGAVVNLEHLHGLPVGQQRAGRFATDLFK